MAKTAPVHPWTSPLSFLTPYRLHSLTQIPLNDSQSNSDLRAWYGEIDYDYLVGDVKKTKACAKPLAQALVALTYADRRLLIVSINDVSFQTYHLHSLPPSRFPQQLLFLLRVDFCRLRWLHQGFVITNFLFAVVLE